AGDGLEGLCRWPARRAGARRRHRWHAVDRDERDSDDGRQGCSLRWYLRCGVRSSAGSRGCPSHAVFRNRSAKTRALVEPAPDLASSRPERFCRRERRPAMIRMQMKLASLLLLALAAGSSFAQESMPREAVSDPVLHAMLAEMERSKAQLKLEGVA